MVEPMKKTTTKDWEIKTLGEVLKLEYGKPLPQSDRKTNGLYCAYGANGEKARTDKFYYDKPSIIVGRKGSAGELTLVKDNFWPLDVTYFITFDEKSFDLKYLYLLLKSCDLPRLATGVKPGINRNEVYKLKKSVPPLPEQKRIVKVLDEKFGVIEELQNITKKQIADVKELFESRLGEVYSSPDYNFGNLGDSVNIKTGKLNSNAAVVGGDYPFFTCSRQASQIDSYSFDCDAVLLAGNNASADFNVKHFKGKFDAYQRTYVITVLNNAELDIRFVYNLLLHGLAKFKESAVGAGTKFLKIGMIQDFQLPLFTLKEQKQIVKELDELSGKTKELETIFHQKIADLEELKKSYLADAFAGKL